jgi:hypothetical protein
MGTLGSRAVSIVQEDFGAGVYFNPYAEVDGMVKYAANFPFQRAFAMDVCCF